MFATVLIVFRESLEAALLVGVVAAATRGLVGRGRWLGAGVAAGMLGAIVLALLAGQLSSWLDGLGQDVVNIGVLTLALSMLLWHCLWVRAHTRQMVNEAQSLSHSVRQGQRAPWALLVLVALAVLREGAETVLFVSGSLSASTGVDPGSVLLSVVGGISLGALVGLVIYAGLTQVPPRHVFSVTDLLMALLAASLGSQLVRSLAQAGFLESGASPVWDSSLMLAQDSPVGTFMHALVGYDARPSAAQLTAYVAVLGVIFLGERLHRSLRRDRRSP